MLKVYGLKTCDTCRKALKWLSAEQIVHEFVDVRADGVTEDQIAGWLAAHGPGVLINTSSTTWRQLSEEEKQAAQSDPATALAEHPTLIKRPVFVDGTGEAVAVGFKAPQQDLLKTLG